MMTLNRRDLVQTGLGIGLTMAAVPAAAQNAAPSNAPPPASAGASADDQPVPTADHRINIITLRDLEAEAKTVLPAYSFAYVAGGAGDEWTMRENEAAPSRRVVEMVEGSAKMEQAGVKK